MPQLDIYRDWLRITETERPLNHYQLLRLKKFEDDPTKVRQHYRKLNSHVRKFATGQYAQQSQDLLNELAKAMLCLTDLTRKREYDATLGRKTVEAGRQRTLEEILLERGVVDQAQITKARNYANAVGVEVRDALIQQKLAKPEVVMPAYAESVGLPYLDLADLDLDARLLRRVPAVLARQHSFAPVLMDERQLLVASPHMLDPHVEEELRLRLNMPVRTVLCTPADIHDVINKYYPREAVEAERTAGPAVPAAVESPVASAKPGKTQAAAPAVAGPVSPEERKRRRSIALVAFNFSFMIAMIVQSFVLQQGIFASLAISVVLGAAVGGMTLLVLGMGRRS